MRTIAPHGTRTRYLHRKCRCEPCREANSAYAAARYRNSARPNPLVPATAARKHLRLLNRHGVGIDSVSDVTGLGTSPLQQLRAGRRERVTLKTEQLILGVTIDAYAGGARIPARRTIYLVKRLRGEGFTYERLAVQLNLWPETLHRLVKRNGTVLADTQMRVEKFYNRLMLEAA